MSNKLYDVLKFVAQIVLPAIAVLYFSLASTLGLPYGKQVVEVITAIDLFLGTLLGISSVEFNKNNVITTRERK